MAGVEIDAERRSARVEAGARWWDVTPKAAEHGLAALHGSSPEVNVVGYALGGGLSWMCRKHGMLVHHITAFEVVTADGRIVRADAESEPDLFWALRGGGGSFGLVTAVEFDLFPVDSFYAGVLFFEYERAAEVLKAWREWSASVPEEMMSVGRLMQFPPLELVPEPVRGKSFTLLQFIYTGDEAEGAELIAPLRELGPVMDTVGMVPPDGLAELHMDPVEPVPYLSDHMLLGELPAEAIDELDRVAGADSNSPLLSIELRTLGGALARRAESPCALASLNGSYLMFAVGAVMAPEMAEPIKATLAKVNEVFAPHDAGRYFSFTEVPVDLERIFPAETVARLREVKRAYDPDDLFRANHQVTPA
jgi:FAD/FMN-containing dehydrogenase